MSVLDIILELIKNVKIGIMRNMEKKKNDARRHYEIIRLLL